MKNSSVTDWIQAIAVVIAIFFAIWEFVLNDRIQENYKKNLTSNLILKATEEWFPTSLKALHNLSLKSKNTLNDRASLKPLEVYYDTWGFCYENELCDKKLALKYICEDLVAFDTFMEEKFVEEKSNEKQSDRDYYTLLQDCKKK